MTHEKFWQLISVIDTQALEGGAEDSALYPLERVQECLPPEELESFEEVLSQCLYQLDGRKFADNSGESGDSDDAFLYTRCYVVAKGLKYFKKVLKAPTLMPKSLNHWCESILYLHRRIWAEKTGKDEEDWEFHASVSYETGSNEAQWT